MALAVGILCNAQAADLYKASRNVALRAPAVPLITSDPICPSGRLQMR